MDEAEVKRLLESLPPETVEAIKKMYVTKTVRDMRAYYHVSLGQFETVVDGRDCGSSDTALEYATMNRTQAWYYDPITNNDPPRVTTWTHSQFVDWLRR